MKRVIPNLTERQLKTASSKAAGSLSYLITLGDGIPVNSITLQNLAECNPQDGLEPLLPKTCSNLLFPVYLRGSVDYDLRMFKDGRTWKLHSIGHGGSSSRIALEAIKRFEAEQQGKAFRIIQLLALNRICLSFTGANGQKLVCLNHWPSDPADLKGQDCVTELLTLFKKQAQELRDQYQAAGPDSDLGG